MVGGGGEGLAADRAHPAHVPAGAGDDAEQREALQGQVVEAVAAAQGERGVEFGAGPAQVVAFEAGAAPAQMGQRLQLRFGGQLGDLRDHERGRVGGPVTALVGAELLGDRPQHCEVRRLVRRPGLSCVAEVGLRRGQFPGLEMGQRGGQGQPGIGRGGGGADPGQRPAQRPVVPGEDQRDGEAVQQLGQQGPVAAGGACSRARTGSS